MNEGWPTLSMHSRLSFQRALRMWLRRPWRRPRRTIAITFSPDQAFRIMSDELMEEWRGQAD